MATVYWPCLLSDQVGYFKLQEGQGYKILLVSNNIYFFYKNRDMIIFESRSIKRKVKGAV